MNTTVAAGLLLLLLAAGLAAAESATANIPAICTEELGVCKCTRTEQNYWVQVNCTCQSEKDLLEVKAEKLPPQLIQFEISRCKEVRLLNGALSQQSALRKIHVHNVGVLTIKKNSIFNVTSPNFKLHIENCSTVVIESSAYKGNKHPHSVLLEQANHVIIQPSAFSWMQDIVIRRVARLEFHKNAFSQSGAASTSHGPSTTVYIEDSLIPEIPSLAFPLSASELRIKSSKISVIRRDAFCGIRVTNLSLEDCFLHTLEKGAFSGRTLIDRLKLHNLTIEEVQTNAVQSAIADFTLQDSRIDKIHEGGINVTVARVTLMNNVLKHLHSRGLVFSQWDRLDIVNNTFRKIGFSGMWAPSERNDGAVIFSHNLIDKMASEKGVLFFGISPKLDVVVHNNRFERDCMCSDWLREELTPRRGEPLPSDYAHKSTDFWVEAFKNSSYCVLGSTLSRCFGSNTTTSYMYINKYWDNVCRDTGSIHCQNGEVVDRPNAIQSETLLRDVSTLWILVTFVMVCIMLLVLIQSTVKCYRRYPGNRLSVSKIFPCLRRREVAEGETPTLPIGTEVSNSIDILPGPRKQKRKKRHKRRNVAVTANEDNTLIMDEVTLGSESGTVRTTASTMESTIMVMDSETQTGGSGTLVDDILSDLKEKLKDPKAYGETREMIENIYNQITTESSVRPTVPAENTYAEIQPSTSAYQCPVVCEYVDPRDRRTNIYTEPQSRLGRIYNFITGNAQNHDVESRPSTAVTDYMAPSDARINVYSEVQQSSRIQSRPLPRTPEELSDEDSEGTSESDDDTS
ncbi:Hypothetical predicted protein [Cloeon dipterum]|uniref:Right handed beta helix domain-containing protein n=3 Tax=Cloeon dipterum TaxID=197152 RepID=A0A8S1DGI7_9INSE|nr:Hypothetical predicted protein [Cloeon dipterum]